MPSYLALSARLSWIPVPGQTMTPIDRMPSMASLRLKGAALACLRLLRRWLFGDLGYLDRLLDGTQQGHLRQPRRHPARPAGDPRAYALRTRMLDPKIFAEFCDAYTQEWNRLRMDARQHQCCRGPLYPVEWATGELGQQLGVAGSCHGRHDPALWQPRHS